MLIGESDQLGYVVLFCPLLQVASPKELHSKQGRQIGIPYEAHTTTCHLQTPYTCIIKLCFLMHLFLYASSSTIFLPSATGRQVEDCTLCVE